MLTIPVELTDCLFLLKVIFKYIIVFIFLPLELTDHLFLLKLVAPRSTMTLHLFKQVMSLGL